MPGITEKSGTDFSRPPTVYGYDSKGVFTHTELCSPDPLESEIKGEVVWLIPANATLIEPPVAVEKHVRVFKNGAWVQVQDNRGTKYWLPGDDWQTEPRDMKDLGPLPDGAVTVRPQKPAPTEVELFQQLRAERDRRLAATDYLLMPDYPLDDALKKSAQAYRQALRDLPSQEGSPWDGGGEETPWPQLPSVCKSSVTNEAEVRSTYLPPTTV